MARTTETSYHICDVVRALDAIAPPSMAQSWDNVGLLAGDHTDECSAVLLCIDLTDEVVAEATGPEFQLVVSYHPPIFRPVNRLLATSIETDSIVFRAISEGLAIYSPHTALDAAPGGTNDVLAGLCDLSEVEPFEYVPQGACRFKLVTFVPKDRLEAVVSAMASAGAGRIGDYTHCSYRLDGEGTFFGTETTAPRVGRKGRLEKVAETRIEMVVSAECLPEVVDALLRAHPYEEPAYDIYPLAAVPSFGIGRVGRLPRGTTLGRLAERLAKATKSKVMTIVGRPGTRLERAAVCVGAAGRLPLEKPRSEECDVIVTGEIRHHDALTILRTGRSAIALGHWESERPVLPVLARRLASLLPGLDVRVSRSDAPPFRRT